MHDVYRYGSLKRRSLSSALAGAVQLPASRNFSCWYIVLFLYSKDRYHWNHAWPSEASSLTDPCRLSGAPPPPCIEGWDQDCILFPVEGRRTTGEFRIEICLLHTLIYLYLYGPRINTKQSIKIYMLYVQKRVQMSFTSFYIRLCTVSAKLHIALPDQKIQKMDLT